MKAPIRSLIAISFSVISLSAAHAATELEASNRSALTQVCMAAVKGNNAALAKAIRAASLSKHSVKDTVLCNGEPIVEFVEKYGENAIQTNYYLTRGKYKFNDGLAETLTARHTEK